MSKAQTELNLHVTSTIARLRSLTDKAVDASVIKLVYAQIMINDIEAAKYGEFVRLVNTEMGYDYSVQQLKELYRKAGAVAGPEQQAANMRVTLEEIDARVAKGAVLPAEEQADVNMMRNIVEGYDAEIAAGKQPADAMETAVRKMMVENGDLTMDMGEDKWLQPKYIAAVSSILGTGVALFTGTKLSIGSVTGGVVGAGVSYFAADYLLQGTLGGKMNPWLLNTLAAALGTGVGVGSAMAGNLVQGRFFGGTDAVDADAAAIPAPSAESAAYL